MAPEGLQAARHRGSDPRAAVMPRRGANVPRAALPVGRIVDGTDRAR